MRASDGNAPHDLLEDAAEKLGTEARFINWYSWPEVFGSTAGPRGGIGGQAMTTFQVYGFIGHEKAVMYCGGVWRWWRDTSKQRFAR